MIRNGKLKGMEIIKKLVVFDLDGTLSKTDEFSVRAIQQVQRDLGFEESDRETIIGCYGKVFIDFMNTIFPGADASVFEEYKKLITVADKKHINSAKTYPGIEEMLSKLEEDGYELAVCSNASGHYIEMVLNALKIKQKIDYIQALEDHMNSKGESLRSLLDEVKPEKAIMVGDTMFDKQAASENGIPFVGCLYGYRPHEMVDLENVASQPGEIPELINNIMVNL